jgi:hypothetical protein
MILTIGIVLGVIIYLVIGRIIAEKRWDWDGYDLYYIDEGVIFTTIFWPIYLVWMIVKLIASIFIDIDM